MKYDTLGYRDSAMADHAASYSTARAAPVSSFSTAENMHHSRAARETLHGFGL